MNSRLRTTLIASFVAIFVAMFFLPDIAEARRGGGRSFGGSRRSTNTYKSKRTPTKTRTSKPRTTQKNPTSFGGKRLNSSQAYTSKYGTPRKSTPQTVTTGGQSQRYVMNSYGGYGSGLMTGYVMGSTSWLWFTPFHPAFYYSRPYYNTNQDGTIGVYPPTFSIGKVFVTIILAAVVFFIIYAIIKNRKRKSSYGSSSSFG